MPVAVRDDLSEENLRALLAEGHESDTLDYKESCNINVNDELLEIVKDIGAMQIRGGYIIVGADDDGNPSGKVAPEHLRAYEQASFRSKLLKYLDEPFDVRCKDHLIVSDHFVLIYIAPNPNGFAAFKVTGQNSQQKPVFHKGAVYTRHGTASEPWNASDLANVQQGIIGRLKEAWMSEAAEIFAARLPSPMSGALAAAPVGALNWELDGETFIDTVIELFRRDDLVPIQMLLTGIGRDVGTMLADPAEAERVKTILDRLACLSSVTLRLDKQDLFRSVIEGFVAIYNLPVDRQGNFRLEQAMPRTTLWFEIIQRIAAIGALAERIEDWRAVRVLVLQRGKGKEYDYYCNWYRHTLARSAEANLIPEPERGQPRSTLLSFAQQQTERLECLRFDIASNGEDAESEVLGSLCRFDFLACVVSIDAAGRPSHQAFYPSFATYYEWRTRPAAEALLENETMRSALFPGTDAQLAEALAGIDADAVRDSRFRGWDDYFGSKRVEDFVKRHGGSRNNVRGKDSGDSG